MKPFVAIGGVSQMLSNTAELISYLLISYKITHKLTISVEATAKGLVAYCALESYNEPVQWTRSIEPSSAQ